jgi:dephospho-CoA kinase
MSKVIIGLVGELAAGKGTVAAYLKKKYQAMSFGFSDPLRQTLDLYDITKTRENAQQLSTVLRQTFGENILATAMAKRVREATADLIIVDGVRRFTDIKNLQPMLNFNLIYIKTDPEIRYQRYTKRNQFVGDDTMTFEEFEAKDGAEADRQVPKVGKKAKYTIDNNDTLEQLHRQIEEILKKINGDKN